MNVNGFDPAANFLFNEVIEQFLKEEHDDEFGFNALELGEKYSFYQLPDITSNVGSFEDRLFGDQDKATQLSQTDAVALIDGGEYPRLAKAIFPFCSAIGRLNTKELEMGSCILISEDLALVPYNTVHSMNVKVLTAHFRMLKDNRVQKFSVEELVYENKDLGYSIIKIANSPGKGSNFAPLTSPPELFSHPNLALLHHPGKKTLQVSVNTYQIAIPQNDRFPLHDIDINSSGGAYINPEGKWTGVHLGYKKGGLPNVLSLAKIITNSDEFIRAYIDGIFDRNCTWENMKYQIKKKTGELPGIKVGNLHNVTVQNSTFKVVQFLTISERIELAKAIGADFECLIKNSKEEVIGLWQSQQDKISPELYKNIQGIEINFIGEYKDGNWEINLL